ncbi:MAG: 50S ribosomal protein L10 [Actinomycetia bacterium]|nr:50S ribosomal protein L10 [Actinomycetes bacterium]
MVKKEKEVKVEAIKQVFSENNGLIFTDHTRLTVGDSVTVRDKLAENQAYLKVLKNTLALIAAREVFSDIQLDQILKGPTSVVVVGEDVAATAKIIKDFAEEHETLQVKGGILEDQLLTAELIQKIAGLPSREVLLTNLAVTLNSPISGLVTTLSGLSRNLVMVLGAIRKEKENNKN